jgi:hypothetical protein
VDVGAGDDGFGGSGPHGGNHADSGSDAHGGTDGAGSSDGSGGAGDASHDSAPSDAGACNAGLTLGSAACNACVSASCCAELLACDSSCQSDLQCALNYSATSDAGLADALSVCGSGVPAHTLVNCMTSKCFAQCQ